MYIIYNVLHIVDNVQTYSPYVLGLTVSTQENSYTVMPA